MICHFVLSYMLSVSGGNWQQMATNHTKHGAVQSIQRIISYGKKWQVKDFILLEYDKFPCEFDPTDETPLRAWELKKNYPNISKIKD